MKTPDIHVQVSVDPEVFDLEAGLERDYQDVLAAMGLQPEEKLIASDVDALADWQLEQYAKLAKERKQVEDAALRRKKMVDAWAVAETDRLDRAMAHMGSRLHGFLRAMELGSKKKSKKLPHGTIGTRRKNLSIKVISKPLQLEWAKMQKGANLVQTETKVVETVPAATLKAHFEATGEAPDPEECGWEPDPAREVFFVKVSS